MKRVIAVCAIMLAMLLGSCATLFFLRESIRTLEEDLNTIQTLSEQQRYDEVLPLLEEVSGRWEKREHYLARILRHKELETVTQNLVSMSAYLEYGDPASFYSALAQTRLLLRHVWESEVPRLENLLTIKKLP